MPAAKLHSSHRTRVASSPGGLLGALAIAGLGPLACAGHHHISEAPPHPIAVEIQNNLPGATPLTVFITHDQGGFGQMLGTVPGGKVVTFKYTPASWDIAYRFAATTGAQPNATDEGCQQCIIQSPRFNVNDPNTSTVVWDMNANIVQFYYQERQQEPAKDTTKAPAPSGT
jgi:hypothetical protein